MTTIDFLTLAATILAAAIPSWFLLQEQRKNLQLEAELSRAREQVRSYAELAKVADGRAVLAERRAVEVADDRNVELVRARRRLSDALFWFGEWEQAQRMAKATAALVARERMAKAIGAAPASQRRIKEAS